MNPEVTVGLALYDYLPVLVWIWGSYCLVKTIGREIKKPFFYILIISMALVCIGGILKATWKLLIAASNLNIIFLSDAQFPLMGTGFFLMFISLFFYLMQEEKRGEMRFATAISKKFFLPLMVIGSIGSTICLMIIAKKKKVTTASFFYLFFLVVSTAMGYVGARIKAETYYIILLEQTINCFSILLWALGNYFLSRNNTLKIEM